MQKKRFYETRSVSNENVFLLSTLILSLTSFAADTVCSPKGAPNNIVLEVDSANDSFRFLKPGNMVQYPDTLFYVDRLISGGEVKQWINISGNYGTTGLFQIILQVHFNEAGNATKADYVFLLDDRSTVYELDCRSK